jgi:hypothetical protein
VTDHKVNVRISAEHVSKRAWLNNLPEATKVMTHLIKDGCVTRHR